MFCPKCGNQCENVSVCPVCGAALNEQPAAPVNSGFAPVVEAKAPAALAKKLPKNKVALAIVAVVVVLAIVISSIAIAAANKPMTKIASGVEKLLFDTESFKFEVRAGDAGKISGAICWGDDLVSSSFYAKVTEGDEVAYRVGSNKGDFAMVVAPESEYGTAVKGNLPEIYSYAKENRDDVFENMGYEYEDFAEEMEEASGITPDQVIKWFDTIVKKGNINEDTIKEIYDMWLREMYAEEMDEKVENIPDYKTLKKVLVKFITKGLSEEAVEVTDSYKEDGVKCYDLRIDTDEVLKCLYEFLKDNKDLKDFLETEEGKDFMDELEDIKDEKGETVKLTVGVKSGRLALISSKEDGQKVTIEFSEFNKKIDFATEVAAIKDLRDDEDDWMDLSEAIEG